MASRRPTRDSWRARRPAPLASDVVTLEFDGETLVYHHQTGEVHRLDSVGSLVWRFLDGQTTVDDLVIDLAAVFEVHPDVIHDDVTTLLERLEQAFLLADGPRAEPRAGPISLRNPASP